MVKLKKIQVLYWIKNIEKNEKNESLFEEKKSKKGQTGFFEKILSIQYFILR